LSHRQRISTVLIAIVGAVFPCFSAGTPANKIVQPVSAPLIVALGDSVTYGIRDNGSVLLDQTFVSRLGHLLSPEFPGVTVTNAGVRGNTTRDLLLRLDSDVIAKKPNLVILMIGINDASYYDPRPHGAPPVWRTEPRVPLSEFRKNVIEIVKRIKSTGAKVLLVTPNPLSRAFVYSNLGYYRNHDMNGALRKYAAVIASLNVNKHIPLIDLFKSWDTPEDLNKYLVDGMHPNPEGHAEIAALLDAKCQMLLADKSLRSSRVP